MAAQKTANLLLSIALAGAALPAAYGHAIPSPVPQGGLHARGNLLVDGTGQPILLRGVEMRGLNAANPTAAERQVVAAMNTLTFRIIHQRWNMNAVRLPVSSAVWKRDGQSCLDQVAQIVKFANDAGLVAVIAEVEDSHSGAPIDTGLPSADVVTFWKTWAAFFKNNPLVIFDVFNEPSTRNIPGHVAGKHLASDWQFWLRGGTAANGQTVAGMQDLVDAIRSTGAAQMIAVPSFHDALDFQGFDSNAYIRDPDILYEVHPYYDHGLTDAERDANFGFVAARFPVYAGEWGLTLADNTAACQATPRDLVSVFELLLRTLSYFDQRNMSWTAFAFEPQLLITDYTTYSATALDRLWNCGETANPEPGMGQFVILYMTGDPTGFGALSADQIANAAGGFAGPVAPGEILSIYGFQVGPDPGFFGTLDASGRLATTVGEVRVLFDGAPAPIFFAGAFQIVVQVPHSVAGHDTTVVQAFFRDVPSNAVTLRVVDAAPEIFTSLGSRDAIALNQDGSRNLPGTPAAAGSIVVVYATGAGETSPAGETGKPAGAPLPKPLAPLSLTIGGSPAEILFAGEAPGFIGLLQINARIPAAAPGLRAASIQLTAGGRSSQPRILWVQ